MTTTLREIRSIISERTGLSSRIPLSIKEKGENERARLNNLLQYAGPDKETLRVLDAFQNAWLEDPTQFWRTPSSGYLDQFPSPQAEIVGYYLQGHAVDA